MLTAGPSKNARFIACYTKLWYFHINLYAMRAATGAVAQNMTIYPHLRGAYDLNPKNDHTIFRQAMQAFYRTDDGLLWNNVSFTVFIPNDAVGASSFEPKLEWPPA
jgi:hypothetical protein